MTTARAFGGRRFEPHASERTAVVVGSSVPINDTLTVTSTTFCAGRVQPRPPARSSSTPSTPIARNMTGPIVQVASQKSVFSAAMSRPLFLPCDHAARPARPGLHMRTVRPNAEAEAHLTRAEQATVVL